MPSCPLLPEGEAAAAPIASLLPCLKPPHRCWGRGCGGGSHAGHGVWPIPGLGHSRASVRGPWTPKECGVIRLLRTDPGALSGECFY